MFDTIWNDIIPNNILGYSKTKILFNELMDCVDINGNTAEIGVYKGNISKLIKLVTPDKKHYCYDTFCGITNSQNCDFHLDGEFNCNLETVKKNINSKNVIYKVGYFPDTFDQLNEKFGFVYSDTATYIGAKNSCLLFCNRMVSGGKIVFYVDDNCKGVKLAIQEFIEREDGLNGFNISHISCFCIFTKKTIMT